MKRLFDIVVAGAALCVLVIPMALVAIAVRLDSKGPALYWSHRVGRDNRIFAMPKFRSMRTGAPVVATHLLSDGHAHLTRLGPLLRRSSIDELPQLWAVLTGAMSIVGPRPALYNQRDLIALRTAGGVHRLRPGLTGLAQINGRDELTIEEKVAFDKDYLDRASLALDVRIILETAWRVVLGRGIVH